ncbi:MAG: NAD(P)/FAD-dependent oxidoreductase [Gemmatimonadota bacterium]
MAGYDVIVIGAGLNGLTAAVYLAKAGKRVLVIDERAQMGGTAVSEELAPGYRIEPVAIDSGWLSPQLMRDLDLARHGLALLPLETALVTPRVDGAAFTLWSDQRKTLEALRKESPRDAEQWPAFTQTMSRLAGFLGVLYTQPAPDMMGAGVRNLLELATMGRKLRALGKADLVELLRTLPMPVAELLDDTFESESLKATIGAGGVSGICQGVRSAGTAFVLLHNHVGGAPGAFRMRPRARGGASAIASALLKAALAAGVQTRTGTRVQSIRIKDGRAIGVQLASGEEIGATTVLSSADARSTLLELASPSELDPELVRAVSNIRFRGVSARVHLALGELPRFKGVEPDALRGIISIAPTLDYIERAYDDAKHGGVSKQPLLEITIPSLTDPGTAPPGKHVMSITMQYAPYTLKQGVWDNTRRAALGEDVIRLLEQYAPGLSKLILHQLVLTPADLEERFGLPEGSVDDGEFGLDQILFMRPLAGWSRYRTPITGLYLGGSGSHPGRTIVGGSGHLAARTILNDR